MLISQSSTHTGGVIRTRPSGRDHVRAPSKLQDTALTSVGGGVDQTESDKNRTAWPLDGGSVVFKGSHAWAYTFVNLGLGEGNTTNFNITLVEGFNQTGNGTFCFPKVTLPSGIRVENGSEASIQVIQVNEHGSALYNVSFSPPRTHLLTV